MGDASMNDASAKGWTIDTLATYNDALREAEEKFQTERDRRYSEVANEREKALKIKEEADKVALDLARQIQTYKDEQANELREQINSERGDYATKNDLSGVAEKLETALKPLADFVTAQQGRADSRTEGHARVGTTTAVIGTAFALFFVIFTFLNYQANAKPTVTTPTVTVTTMP
jgi:Fe2+ transport system protein B